jgi:hypothetical protein
MDIVQITVADAEQNGSGLCLSIYKGSQQIKIKPGFCRSGDAILGKLETGFGFVKIYLKEITRINTY